MAVDWIEVGRVAHQLELDHGRMAHLFAEKLAADAKEERRADGEEFWNAVAATLRPRA